MPFSPGRKIQYLFMSISAQKTSLLTIFLWRILVTCAKAPEVFTCFGTDVWKQFHHNSANYGEKSSVSLDKSNLATHVKVEFIAKLSFETLLILTIFSQLKLYACAVIQKKLSYRAHYRFQCQESTESAEPWSPLSPETDWSNTWNTVTQILA